MIQLKAFYAKISADKPRFYVATTLVALMMLMWGRLLLRQIPRTSVAAPAAEQIAKLGLSDGDEGSKGKSGSENPSRTSRMSVYVLNQRPSGLRDPFDFDDSPYKRTILTTFEPDPLRPDAQAPDLLAERGQLLAELERIAVQSIVSGTPPLVMIDGRVLSTGDEVQGFVISRISYAERIVEFRKSNLTFRVQP